MMIFNYVVEGFYNADIGHSEPIPISITEDGEEVCIEGVSIHISEIEQILTKMKELQNANN